MTWRSVTLTGYVLIAAVAAGMELVARRSGRPCLPGDALDAVLRHRPLRVLVQAGWLWLGWHLFVRVDWH